VTKAAPEFPPILPSGAAIFEESNGEIVMTIAHEQARPAGLAGFAAFAYSGLCYLFFFATFLYAIGFIAGLPGFPNTIDNGPQAPAALAVLIDLALLGVFAVQHSVMARPAFKRAWTKIVPKPVERSTYVLAATLCLVLLIWQWRPLADTVWTVTNPTAQLALWVIAGIGWAILFASTFLINHFELFGINQAYDYMVGHRFEPPSFKTPALYKIVRHPLYLGFVIGFWSTPHMSVGHLLFAIGCTGYILIGIFFEERDLVAHFGQTYRDYQRRVPMLLPFGRRARAGSRR
jgi:protein-S-isoprenylcysteine O-methyltransferase Ste14